MSLFGKPQFIKTDANALDQDLQRELFGAGASVRDTGIVQCENDAVQDAVVDILENKNISHESVEYESKTLDKLSRELRASHIVWATNRRRGAGRGNSEGHNYE